MKITLIRCSNCKTDYNAAETECPFCHTPKTGNEKYKIVEDTQHAHAHPEQQKSRNEVHGWGIFAVIMTSLHIITGVLFLISPLLGAETELMLYGAGLIITSAFWGMLKLISQIEYNTRR